MMTRDEILNATPEQLRVWVAEEVMGWRLHDWREHEALERTVYCECENCRTTKRKGSTDELASMFCNGEPPDYPGDWGAAGEAVEKMYKDGWDFNVGNRWDSPDRLIWGSDFYIDLVCISADGKTAPEAICKASLLAVMKAE